MGLSRENDARQRNEQKGSCEPGLVETRVMSFICVLTLVILKFRRILFDHRCDHLHLFGCRRLIHHPVFLPLCLRALLLQRQRLNESLALFSKARIPRLSSEFLSDLCINKSIVSPSGENKNQTEADPAFCDP